MIYVQIMIFIAFCMLFVAFELVANKNISIQEMPTDQNSPSPSRLFFAQGALARNNLDVWSLYTRLEKGQDVQDIEHFLANPQMFFQPHILEELPDYLSTPVQEGNTLLHLAIVKGYQRIVEKLYGLGVDVMYANHEGNTPLHLAAKAGHKSSFLFLYQRMPLLEVKNNDGLSAKQMALQYGHYQILSQLVLKKL